MMLRLGTCGTTRVWAHSPVGENSSLMRMARIAQANRRATNRQITVQYNSGVQNGISERTTQYLSRMGYCGRRPHRVPLLSTKNKKKKRLQWSRDHQHWTIEELKNIAWNMKVPLEEGLNKTIQYFSRELEHQANNQYIPKPKAARQKKGQPRHHN